MIKRFGIKKYYATISLILIICGPLMLIFGVLLLIFFPVGKWFSLFFILFSVFAMLQGKAVTYNEINVSEDYVYLKQGVLFKNKEIKLFYNEIVSVKGNNGGAVLFDTKTGTIIITYIDGAIECADMINYRLKTGEFETNNLKTEKVAEEENNECVVDVEKLIKNRQPKEGKIVCPYCGHVQSENIIRCLKCERLISTNN